MTVHSGDSLRSAALRSLAQAAVASAHDFFPADPPPLAGYSGDYVGNVPAIGPLADGSYIPRMGLHDGPQGVANGNKDVTCWPSALTVVQTWDRTAMYDYGAGMGAEQYAKGSTVMLGPGVNLARVPWNGRNFEYQGEDPFLAYHTVYAETLGIQSQNVSGCVKHFFANNEEDDRSGMSSNVGDRAARELYYKAFAGSVDAGVGSVMCSYNRVNGTWACEDTTTIGVLKKDLNFAGYVMSDWGATHSTVPSALGGLDQQMPDDSYFGAALAAAVAAGTVSQARIDDMIMRMLVPMYALNIFANGNSPSRNTSSPAMTPAHQELALSLAQRSITLLSNPINAVSGKPLLPVSAREVRSVVIFGDTDTISGGGSGGVERPYVITPFEGIYSYLNFGPATGNCVTENDVDYNNGFIASWNTNSPADCCSQCAHMLGCSSWTRTSDGTCYFKNSASGRRSSPGVVSGNCTSAPSSTVNVTYSPTQDPAAAAALASAFDLAVVVVATDSSEGSDRVDLFLPAWQDKLAAAVGAANANTVVVARCPGACHMPWASSVGAILFEMLPGQESGNSIATTIFGSNVPSGKLPITFPTPPASGSGLPTDTWLSAPGGGPVVPTSYPGTDRGRGFPEVDFPEGLTMGYRWYDAQGTSPQWAFGHGLSYATFAFSNLAVAGTVSPTATATVYASVCNTAGPAAAEVAQLYIGYPAGTGEPIKQLKGFQKVSVTAGDCAGVAFKVGAADLQIWDVGAQAWTLPTGTYTVSVGSSSIDLPLTGQLIATA